MTTNPSIREIYNSPHVKEVFTDLFEFIGVYQEYYFNRQLGGTWLPGKTSLWQQLSNSIKGIRASRITGNPGVVLVLQFLHDIIHTCYNHGLCCWWAPLFIFKTELDKLNGNGSISNLVTPTFDGLVGFLFDHKYETSGKDSSKPRSSMDIIYDEMILASLSEAEIRMKLGDLSEHAISTLKSWGYYHNPQKRDRDFNMLFDKLFLGLSNTEIAFRYPVEDAGGQTRLHKTTIQRNLSKLADLLWIELPRAKTYHKAPK